MPPKGGGKGGKGLSFDEKKRRLTDAMHKSKSFFTMKELEKLGK